MQRLPIAAAALAAILAATPALAQETRMPRLISLTGHGEVGSVPDMAIVTTGVVSQGATAAEALAANTKAMNGLFAALKAAGIAEQGYADLQLHGAAALQLSWKQGAGTGGL